MTMPYPVTRTIRRALGVLERLPAEALADNLAERLIDRLDEAGPDPDLEPEEDSCEAGECGGMLPVSDHGAGEPGDAEQDNDDCGANDDEPQFPDQAANLPLDRPGPERGGRRMVRVLRKWDGRWVPVPTGSWWEMARTRP